MFASLVHQLATTDVVTTSYTTTTTSSSIPAVFWIAYVALIILGIVTMWRIFVKAGKPGWASIVPIYNGWTLFEIGGKPGWWVLLFFIPFVNIVAIVLLIMAYIEMCRRFGKSPWFVLLFFVYIGWLILAFDKSTYNGGSVAAETNGAPTPPAPQPPVAPAAPQGLVQ